MEDVEFDRGEQPQRSLGEDDRLGVWKRLEGHLTSRRDAELLISNKSLQLNDQTCDDRAHVNGLSSDDHSRAL